MLSCVQSRQTSQPLPLLAAQHGGAVGIGFSEEVAAHCGDEGRDVRRTRAQAPGVEDDDSHTLMRRPHDEAAAADAVKHCGRKSCAARTDCTNLAACAAATVR